MYQPSRSPFALNTTRPRTGGAQQPAQHDGGIRQVIDAPPRHPGHAFQHAAGRGGDNAGQVAGLFARNGVVMHHVQRVAGLGDMHARQRPPRPAHQIQIAADMLAQPRHAGQIGLGQGAGAHHVVAGALGQPQHAQLQGARLAAHAAGQLHHFQRAAADIGQHPVRGGNAT